MSYINVGDGKLKENLLLENDITLIPRNVWKLFVDFYGLYAHRHFSLRTACHPSSQVSGNRNISTSLLILLKSSKFKCQLSCLKGHIASFRQ
ncbi:uncharacterized protein DC041_0004499 [Schistosoma bovis]|uniref:DUSP domain-containing protein n=1 Tax=Schistosoma bovis TaxID=6184 RepID=A0A430Q3P4_SCHBO|nr:uncharacterized protein DC041_0004499 [Schistosoma bovis]